MRCFYKMLPYCCSLEYDGYKKCLTQDTTLTSFSYKILTKSYPLCVLFKLKTYDMKGKLPHL